MYLQISRTEVEAGLETHGLNYDNSLNAQLNHITRQYVLRGTCKVYIVRHSIL